MGFLLFFTERSMNGLFLSLVFTSGWVTRPAATASIDSGGTISSGIIWDLAGPLYTLTDWVTFNDDAALAAEPGVSVEPNSKL